MAITATIVYAKANRLRYLIVATVGSGEQVDIPSTGGATPDMLTDAPGGLIKQLANAKATGWGKIAAGGISSDAIARALWLSENALSLIGTVPTAIIRFTPRTGATQNFTVNVARGPADQQTCGVSVVANSAVAQSGYLDIEIPGQIGA